VFLSTCKKIELDSAVVRSVDTDTVVGDTRKMGL
jgi:hypothetical protein